ncbi:hypothetical protein HN371_26625 [Candidatus Poribacteria bacterium]|jgi:hypothetical protein|nr:hypothetical protein [Candidatus Poribacteria bacterium]MBT5536088.1 hypothetical protein [Candidatus Poribacteria bacterium]MBT5713266.1 hypothetical protein [Candidatus Poribacteria bacterium]MBT7804561.1 hypothetical protein [Candidatus Poribacteria bacterium]
MSVGVRAALAVGACLLLASAALAQGDTEDVVYLRNGSIIRGRIALLKPGESVTLQTRDGNVFVWSMDEIREVKQEPAFQAEGVAPAPLAGVDPSSIGLADLGVTEARGMLLAAHESLARGLSRRHRATRVQWVGVAGWLTGGIIVASADSFSARDDPTVTTGSLIALAGVITMAIGAVQETNAMDDIVKLKDTLDARLFGIAKPVEEEKPPRRTRF